MQDAVYNLLTFFFFVFGSLLGSFCNVVILRTGQGRSVVFPPSSCPNCSHKLAPADLAPVFSWLFLRGRCRYCKAPISVQYPLIEAAVSAIVGFSFVKTGLNTAFICLASSLTIWLAASVIFLRNEVKAYQPYFWAVFYVFILNAFFAHSPAKAFIYAVVGAAVVFFAALFGCKKAYKSFAWGCLAAIFIFYLAKPSCYAPLALLLLLPLLLNLWPKTQRRAEILFFIMQLAGIACVLALPVK